MQKRSVKLYIVIYVISLLLFHCGIKNPVDDDYNGSGFNIYLLRDESIKFRDINPDDIAPGMLDIKPWLSAYDIEFYDYSSHILYLNKSMTFDWDEIAVLNNRPFVVTAGGEICYIGYFHALYSSWMPEENTPMIVLPNPFPSNQLHIIRGFYGTKDINDIDIRNDKRVRKWLLFSGKYRDDDRAF